VQPRTVSLRTFLVVVGVLAVALVIGLAGIGKIEITPATVEATANQSQPQEITYITQEGSPDHPDQELLSRIYEGATQSVVSILARLPASRLGNPARPQGGQGSGWVWDEDGHIVTNNHVVENATEIIVNFANGMWAEAELVARDPQSDLAVLRVEAPDGVSLRPLVRAESLPKVGHYTIALGSPFGLENSMSLGIVSALGRSFPMGDPGRVGRYSLPDVIQTDAAINPGNSGGPLLDLSGRVVGVNFAIRTEERSITGAGVNSGVGFAIPITVVERVVPALIEDGEDRYPFLGVSGMTVSAPVAAEMNLETNVLGVYVSRGLEGGPSVDAGVRRGDIIVSIDGNEVRSFEDVISYLILQKSPGETVELGVLRNGRSRTIDVELATRPATENEDPDLQWVSMREAIEIAAEAVAESEDIGTVLNSSARGGVRGGVRVWIVTLEGVDGTATVVVEAEEGEVLGLEVDAGN